MKESIQLRPEVAAKFKAAKKASVKCHWRHHQNIDLRKITLDRADTLSKEGFPYLIPLPTESKKKEKLSNDSQGATDTR